MWIIAWCGLSAAW
ncbi:hypothetical protein L1057_28440 [Escherichia coli]|nr:hypothetical protein [Escherichia coli]MCH8600409.1 hypothetical protein [Escherichia coli]MCM4216912.1 hypothetical protein [Escherichia coli]MCM4253744.1 hypothetical protein [Escherichia coli]MCM4348797.1 hypothetical protein [Escherichia coli]MCM4454524.1 hypothetical protein [Escherichia coli]